MNHRKPFSKAGDIIGKWRFERKLTYEEKVAHYQERASSDADNQTSKSMIRREWVAATCLACSCEQYVRADHVRCGNSSQCHACRRAAQANPYCHPEHRWYPIYTRLNNAQQRCCNAENPAHKDYGQRGVRIHARYCIAAQTVMHGSGRRAVEKLVADLGLPPRGDFDQFQLDRIKNDHNAPLPGTMDYRPGNVRWADGKTQSRNRRNTVKVTTDSGLQIHINELAELVGVTPGALKQRLASGRYGNIDDLMLAIGGKARARILKTAERVTALLRAGRCWASPDGRVFSVKPNGVIELNQNTTTDGYLAVKLNCRDKDGAHALCVRVHRIVALQYHRNPHPDRFLMVAHRDDNPVNNHKDNLCWCDFRLNAQARFRPVVYPPRVRHSQSLSPLTEADIEARLRAEYIDTTDHLKDAEKQLRWGLDRAPILTRLAADSRYPESVYHPNHPCSGDAWRLLLAPSNHVRFEDGNIILAVRVNGRIVRRSIFDVTPSRDWAAFFVWYSDELTDISLDFAANGWPPRSLEEPERANLRNLFGRRRKGLWDQKRIVSDSLFLKFPHKAKLLFPDPKTGALIHPLYISSGNNQKSLYVRCEGCMRRILSPYTPKSITREPTKRQRNPLCAACQRKNSVRNLRQNH